MLRNRSRTVTTKQAIMADQNPIHSSANNPTKPVSSFLGSPRFFNGFLSRTISYPERALVSPTSILDARISPSFVTPFRYDNILSQSPTTYPEINNKSSSNKQNPEAIGLALVHSINEEKSDEKISRMVVYGAKLKVQIPPINSQPESPNSPADFGIKTREYSQPLSPLSGIPVKDYFSRQLSLKEMELSEDYTCVISHGPNPKTTHIFDDCIVENCGEDAKSGENLEKTGTGFETSVANSPPVSFLSSCHTCKQSLGQGKDIYIYRGERAFCSHECRYQEMLFEGMENEEMDDAF